MSEMTALLRLEAKYVERLAYYAAEKARGNLTADWGECSMVCTSMALEEIRWEINVSRHESATSIPCRETHKPRTVE